MAPWIKMRLIAVAAHAVLMNSNCMVRNNWHSGIRQYSLQQILVCSKSYLQNHVSIRLYAKGRDRPKHEKGKKHVDINEAALSEVISIDVLRTQMQQTIENMKNDYVKNLSLRSTAGSIETLTVSFEGNDYELEELAQVVRKNPKTIILNMPSFPQAIPAVLQAISKSGMNLNPQQEGTSIFLPVPKVTKEHRETLSKNAKALFIKCRDGIKNVQIKFIKDVKNKEKGGLAVDTVHEVVSQIESIANTYIAEAEKVLQTKQSELKGDS